MNSAKVEKQEQIWDRIENMLQETISKDSFLNYPVEKVFHDLWRMANKLFDWLENVDWEEELKKYAQEPFSKMAILAVANLMVFIWLSVNGTVAKLTPDFLSVYMPVALGAEENGNRNSFLPGLKPEGKSKGIMLSVLEMKGNNLSEAACDHDKENGKCSDLCADIEQYIKLTKDMSEEEKEDWQKAASEFSKKQPKKTYTRGTPCAKKNDHPSKSDTKGKHQDEDCCPDPDEWPKPGCAYSASGLNLMLKGPR